MEELEARLSPYMLTLRHGDNATVIQKMIDDHNICDYGLMAFSMYLSSNALAGTEIKQIRSKDDCRKIALIITEDVVKDFISTGEHIPYPPKDVVQKAMTKCFEMMMTRRGYSVLHDSNIPVIHYALDSFCRDNEALEVFADHVAYTAKLGKLEQIKDKDDPEKIVLIITTDVIYDCFVDLVPSLH